MSTVNQMIFHTSTSPDSSPYALLRDPTKKIVRPTEFIPVTDTIIEESNELDKDGKKKRVFRKIRYMADHNSIYVDDQEKSGVSTKYGKGMQAGERKSRNDVIITTDGKLVIEGDMQPNLVEYLQKCNYNGSNVNRDAKKTILFYFNDVKKKAKDEFSRVKLIDKARSLVLTLEGTGRKLLDVAMACKLDTNSTEEQLLLLLRGVAESNPELVIGIIAEDKAEIDLIVDKCLNQGILEFTGWAYRYPNAENNIKGFSGKQKPEIAFKAFVKWLGEEDGQADLATLKKLIANKERELAKQAAA